MKRKKRTVTISVVPTDYYPRVWIKAVDGNGKTVIVLNVERRSVTWERNRLAENLSGSGEWDEVIGDAIQPNTW